MPRLSKVLRMVDMTVATATRVGTDAPLAQIGQTPGQQHEVQPPHSVTLTEARSCTTAERWSWLDAPAVHSWV